MTSDPEDNFILPIGTAVLWIGCLFIGALGLFLRYPHPRGPDPQPPPVEVKWMNVEVVKGPPTPLEQSSPDAAPADSTPQPPPPPEAQPAPPLPQMVAVTPWNPSIPFPKPVEGPTRLVDATQAAPKVQAPQPPRPATAPSTVRLVYGQGEGDQPKPEYPREAAMAHQQGAVTIRFTVGADGRVQSAEVIAPCRWPLLNQSALRTVRDDYRFRPGSPRSFEISIEFKLQ
jgi:protein TonB